MSAGDVQIDLNQYPKNWQLTKAGKVFRQEDNLLISVRSAFGPAMLKQAIEGQNLTRSSSLLHWYQGTGSAKILKKRKDTQLLEWIDGPALSSLLDGGQTRKAFDVLGEVVGKLHAPKDAPLKTRLASLSSHFHPLLEQRFNNDPLLRHGARLARFLLRSMEKQTPLHGDLGFDKILHHSRRGWLTIAPRGFFGDPHFELAHALCHRAGQSDLRRLRQQIRQRAALYADRLSLNPDRLLTFAFCHACLQLVRAQGEEGPVLHWRDMSELLLDTLVE